MYCMHDSVTGRKRNALKVCLLTFSGGEMHITFNLLWEIRERERERVCKACQTLKQMGFSSSAEITLSGVTLSATPVGKAQETEGVVCIHQNWRTEN